MAFPSPSKLVAGILCGALLAAATITTAHTAEKFPKVERESALADQKAHDAEWRARIAASKSRVFFTDAEWPQVIAEVAKIPADHPFRTYAEEALKKVLAKPLPVYMTPEEAVTRKVSPSLYSAMEELWQRAVGEDLITLSLAVKLNFGDEATLTACRARIKELALAACSWPTWGRGNGSLPNNADLACGHLSLGISYAYNLHGATVFTETERDTIRKAMREKVAGTLAGLYGAAYWATGYQDNHLQVDVAGLGVAGTVFYDEISEAPEWMAAARQAHANISRFSQADGSSDEGIPYWSYARWATVHYIEGTQPVTGAESMYHDAFLKNAISWRLYSSTCGFAATLPWGDAPPKDYYGPHFIMLRVGAVCGDPTGLWLTERLPFRPQGGTDAPMITLMFGRKAFASKEQSPAVEFAPGPDAHFPINDGVTTRSGWSSDDFIVALKSGFTNRNHSHLDAGALALAFGGKWSLRAPGYGKGSSQKGYWDSSKLRWTYYSNATESHTALLVNGKNQRHDSKARGTVDQFLSAPRWAWASVDLTSAYYDVAPTAGARRSLLHRRGDYALVLDAVNAPEAEASATPPQPLKVEWLAQFSAEPAPVPAAGSGAPGNTVQISGGGDTKNRELLITPLDSTQTFTRREPTAEHVDLPKESIRSYALSATGSKVRFAVLLQPRPLTTASAPSAATPSASSGLGSIASGQTVATNPGESTAPSTSASSAPLSALTATYETEENGAVRRITIQRPGSPWTDRIVLADSPRTWKLDAGATATATAELVATRQTSGTASPSGTGNAASLDSLVSTLTTELSVWGITYKGAPASISIQRIGQDVFLIDADRDIQSTLTLPKGMSLFELTQQSPAPGTGKRYALGTSKDAATSAAQQWLAR